MQKNLIIGVDIGSTNFRLGVVTPEGEIVARRINAVGHERQPGHVVEQIATHVRELREEFPEIKGVGVGIPGIVDSTSGVVCRAPHYPGWIDAPFQKLFEEAFDLKVYLDNDANMIACGEGWLGAGKGVQNFLMVTLGTGIGGGIVRDGKIWHGDNSFAGEIGHVLVDFYGPTCNCGSRGCLEMYASATGLHHLVKEADDPPKDLLLKRVDQDLDRVTPEILHELALDGDIFSSIIWKKFGAYLGAGMASLVNTLGMTHVVIGGGVSRAWYFFTDEMHKEFGRRTYPETARRTTFVRTKLSDNAGILGSARAFSTL